MPETRFFLWPFGRGHYSYSILLPRIISPIMEATEASQRRMFTYLGSSFLIME